MKIWICFFKFISCVSLLPRFLRLCFSSSYNPYIILALNFQISLLTHSFGLNYFLYPGSSFTWIYFSLIHFLLCFSSTPLPCPSRKGMQVFWRLCSRNAFLCLSPMNISWAGIDFQVTIISSSKGRWVMAVRLQRWGLPGVGTDLNHNGFLSGWVGKEQSSRPQFSVKGSWP